MGFIPKGRSDHPIMNLFNLGLRVCQFILGVTALGLYAQYLQLENHVFEGQHEGKAVTAVVTATFATVTAIVFGLVPLLTSNFFHVAILCLWDFIIFILWCATFGLFHKEYISNLGGVPSSDIPQDFRAEVTRMQDAVWIDLVCLLLWLFSTILGIAGVFLGRRGR